MKSLAALSVLIAIVGFFSACSSHYSNVPVSREMMGPWLPQAEALELRGTGKLQATCTDLTKDPSMDMLYVEANGLVDQHDPRTPQTQTAEGQITGTHFVPTDTLKQQGAEEATVTVKGNTLTLTYKDGSSEEYVQSSNSEIISYMAAAQKDCGTPATPTPNPSSTPSPNPSPTKTASGS